MKYISILLLLFLTGCSFSDDSYISTMYRHECSTDVQRKQLAKFIVDCAKAANPMSDEEGEDLVEQCERTGKSTICPSQIVCNYMTKPAGFMSSWRSTGYGECK